MFNPNQAYTLLKEVLKESGIDAEPLNSCVETKNAFIFKTCSTDNSGRQFPFNLIVGGEMQVDKHTGEIDYYNSFENMKELNNGTEHVNLHDVVIIDE